MLKLFIKGGREMSRKRYTPEQSIGKLREAEVALTAYTLNWYLKKNVPIRDIIS
jgi:hypothetical protein